MIVSVFSSSFAQREWSAENVPIPYLKDSTQYVSDPDGYLSKDQKDSANFYLQKLNLECGVQNVFGHSGTCEGSGCFPYVTGYR